MLRVTLLNPKGGSGKTTIATSLAGYFASCGRRTALIDHDAQGSSSRWLEVRPHGRSAILGIEAFRNPTGVTRAFQMRVPPGTERIVVDTPAAIRPPLLTDLVREADCVVVPVLPSPIDIDAVSAFIDALGRLDSVRAGRTRVAVIANRVRRRTVIFRELERFLKGQSFPFVTRLRDSQNFVRAGERGLSVLELDATNISRERGDWRPLLDWLEPEPELVLSSPPGSLSPAGTPGWPVGA